jgi:hypothetical protein
MPTPRTRVTELVTAARSVGTAARDDARLCILGAGHCNDLDLGTLDESFATILTQMIDTVR